MGSTHVVRQGEGLSSIAEAYGFAPDTIWQHEQNASLREIRTDPNVLLAGDRLHIPERVPKRVRAATGRLHVFRKYGVPAKLRMQLFRNHVPRANEPFRLTLGSAVIEGRTDADGVLDVWVPPQTRTATLTLGAGDGAEVFELGVGHVDPVTERSGVVQRLQNLGYAVQDEASDAELAAAILSFQIDADLEQTAEADSATVARLEAVHDERGDLPGAQ